MRYTLSILLLTLSSLFASGAMLRSEKILLSTDKASYRQGDTIRISGRILEAQTLLLSGYSKYVYMELISRNDSVLCRQKLATDSACFKGKIILEPDLQSNVYFIRAYTKLMCNFSPTAFTILPIPISCTLTGQLAGNETEQIRFYPEGGHILNGTLQNVAFHAMDKNGFPVETKAVLCKNSGDTIYSDLQTDKNGIGRFSFIPEASSQYYLLANNRKYPCPSAIEAPTLQLNQNKTQLYYSISMPPQNETRYRFLLFHGGAICFQQPVTPHNQEGIIKFSDYPSGLVAGIILNEKDEIVSETLCYYNRQDSVGPFSSAEKAILLNTDLSCPLPDAETYTDFAIPGASNRLKTYLMTRKWGRFPWLIALQDSFSYQYKPETVMALSGRVETERGKPLKKGTLIVINNNNGFTYDAQITDGRFIIGVDDFREGNSFFMQAYNEKGKSYDYNIIPDNDTYPGIINLYKEFYIKEEKTAFETIIDQGDIISNTDNEGNKIYHLPSVTVTARIREKVVPTKEFYGVNYIDEKEFETTAYSNIIPYLERMIGFKVIRYQEKETKDNGEENITAEKYIIKSTRGLSGFSNTISRDTEELVVLLDEKPVDTTWALETLDPSDIRSIERLTPAQAMRYTSLGFAGAILIRTKQFKKADVRSQGIIYTPSGLSMYLVRPQLFIPTDPV